MFSNKRFFGSLLILLTIALPVQAASTGSCYDTTDTVLMLHMDGADASTTFTDSDGGKTVTPTGNAQIDTAQSKFGGASALFDGTNDNLTSADSADWDLGTGDYTIDFWIRMSSTTGERIFIDRNVVADFNIRTDSGVNFEVWQESSLRIQTTSSFPAADTWYHIAVVRSSGTLKYYKDGTEIASSATSTQDIQGTAAIFIGERADGAGDFNGWIDEFRIVKGTAVWTSAFTPPAAAYTDCAAAPSARNRTLLGVGQ